MILMIIVIGVKRRVMKGIVLGKLGGLVEIEEAIWIKKVNN